MESLSFARRCARIAALAAVLWAALYIKHRVAALDFKLAKEVLDATTGFLTGHECVRALHFALVLLQLPVFVALRGILRKQEESLSSLAFSLMLLAVGFLSFADASQFLILPGFVSEYQRQAIKEFTQPPSTANFELFYTGFYNSVTFAVQTLGDLFYAASLIVFAALLGRRAGALLGALIPGVVAVVLAHALALAGSRVTDLAFFAFGLFQAVLMFLLARKFAEILRKRERGY